MMLPIEKGFHFSRSRTQIKLVSGILLAIFFVIQVSTASCGSAIPVILDTDMGIDDWLAIAYIANNRNFELLGVSVSGNGLSPCPAGAINARYLMSLSKKEGVPIGCASSWPMEGYASYPKSWRDSAIALLGEKPINLSRKSEIEDATSLLEKLLENSRAPVDIIAIGTMTNIAAVLIAHPSLKSKIRRITSMGGAVKVPGNLRVHGFTDNHSNTKAEWNYYIDPLAAKIVFWSGLPITLVPLDVTNNVPLTSDFVRQVKSLPASPIQAFVGRTLERLKKANAGEYYHWDPLAAVVAGNPSICDTGIKSHLDIVTDVGTDEGLQNGQLQGAFPINSFFGGHRQMLSATAAGATIENPLGPVIDVCTHVNPSEFERIYLDAVSQTTSDLGLRTMK